MAGIVPQSPDECPPVLAVNQQSLHANPQSLDEIRASVQLLNAKPSLKDLFNIVTPDYAVHWKTIGAHLKISNGLLATIGHDNHHKAEDCCNAVWEEWLNNDFFASWYKVIRIVDTVVGAKAYRKAAAGNENVTVNDIIIISSDQLRQFYKNERYNNTEDDWPPYQPDHFTSVALIHHREKHNTEREVISIATKMHKGNFKADQATQDPEQSTGTVTVKHKLSDEYFLGCKSTKDLAEIFAPVQKPSVHPEYNPTAPNNILIEGAPGIGKTILSKEIAFQWANKNLLSEKVLLFLIFLRDPSIQSIKCLKDFVSYAICSSQQSKEVDLLTDYLENTSGRHIAIVFDGYDEISDEFRRNSFIGNIISRKRLKLCGLVITSRPTASAVLHSNCDCRVEILGFTKEDRIKYIHQSLENNPTEIEQLENYLELNPFIDSLCYIPLNMTILICLFKESANSILPKNQTDMNDQFVCITISRFLRKKNIELTLKCLEHLPPPYNQQLKNFSRLAFDLLGKDKVVFNDDDVQQYSNWSDLGLLKTVKYSNYLKHTPIISYNFLHFSLQEFLAAYYVTLLSVPKQVSMMKDKFWNSRYLNSWVMYAGLTKGNSLALKHLLAGRKFIFFSLIFKPKRITNAIIIDKVKCLHIFQCFLEAGDDRICQQVGSYLVDEKIDLSNIGLLAKDMHTLCFFLTRSTTKQWKLLDLSNCYIGDDGCELLANSLVGDDTSKVQIYKFNLSNNQLTLRSVLTILRLAQYFNVKELIITDNHYDDEVFLEAYFTYIIQQRLIYERILSIKTNKKLSVYAVNCKDSFASKVQHYLQINSGIDILCLWNTNFAVDDLLMLLSTSTAKHSKLELNVYNEDSDDQIFNIKSKILNVISTTNQKGNSFYLYISYILISRAQMLTYNVNDNQIIQAMKYSCKPSIMALNVTGCLLSDKSLCMISDTLSNNFKELELIEMSGCNIEDNQCKYFYKALFSINSAIKHLKVFNLSNNKLTDDSTSTIIGFLQYCVIEKLNISCNKIRENAFNSTFKNIYAELKFLYSTSEIPLVIFNDVPNLQTKMINAEKFTTFADVYITKYRSVDTFGLLDSLHVSVSDHFLHRVVFLDCSSLVIDSFDQISLMAKNNVKFQIEDTKISDLAAAKFMTKFGGHLNFQYKIILIAETNLYAYNHKYIEMKTLLPCDNSKITFQFKNCDVPDVIIPEILTNIDFSERIQIFDLSGCKVGDSGFEMFCTCVYHVGKSTELYFHELNLSKNCLTPISIVYITQLLQVCTINKLVLSQNNIDTENFSVELLNSRYDMYSNFGSRVPLILVNNGVNNKMNENQDAQLEHYTIYFLYASPIEDLSNILSMAGNAEYHGRIFLVNPMDSFDTVIQLLLANNMMKITIIEVDLKDDIASHMITELKRLQTRYHDSVCIHYLSIYENFLLTKILYLNKLDGCINRNSLFPSFFHVNSSSSKHWELIDLSNCNIGDYGCTVLLDYFTPLKCTNTVNFLNLTNNNLSSDSTNTIAKLIIYSKLETLFVSYNEVKENHVANAVCKLMDKSELTKNISVQIIRIFKSYCVAVIIQNLVILDICQLLNCKLCNVTYLSLLNCYLNYEDHTDGDVLSIIELNLSQRVLQELENDVKVLEENKKITNLMIKHCNIAHGATTLIASKVLQNNELVHLEISSCKLQPAGLCNIINTLEEKSSLLALNLSNNFIPDLIAAKIAIVISKNTRLEVLNLSGCNLQDGMKDILKSLKNLSSLKFLNLSSIKYHCFMNQDNGCLQNKRTEHLTFSILPSIISNNKSLVYLNISECKITEKELAKILYTISQQKSIKYLDISGNTVSDIVADPLINAVKNNRTIEYLNVSNCCTSERVLFVIFNYLSDLNSLVHIDVSLNGIFSTAAKEELSKMLSMKRKLMHISFSQCNLDAKAIENIILSLKENKALNYLNFSRNQMNQHIDIGTFTIIFNNLTLKHLNISSCNLTEGNLTTIADCLRKMKMNLTHLNISHNYMSRFSAEKLALAVIHSESLEFLDLSGCGFVGFSIIDVSLQQNSKLKNLIIKSNIIFKDDLKVLLQNSNSAESGTLRLEHLDLSDCDLSELHVTTIVRKLCMVSTLKSIDISYNALSTVNIGSVISRNPLVEKLKFSSCELSESQITSILKALSNLSRLKHLDISHNKVADITAIELASALAANPLLEHLNLSNCELSKLHIESIVRTFSKKESFLNFLDISSSKVAENSLCEIDAVIKFNPLLEHLNIANCELSELQIINMFKVLRKTSLLKFLDVSRNEVTSKAANELASVIMNNKSLQYLNLSDCNLEEGTLTVISKSLAYITTLKSIDVSYNLITEKTAQSMAIFISKNVALEYLNFCACFVDNAALAIFKALNQHKYLIHLNIKFNIITNELATLIAFVIVRNIQIKHIDFEQCNLQEAGFIEVINSLSNISTLHYLSLQDNKIPKILAAKIPSLICENSALKYLNLSKCNLPKREVQNTLHAIGKLYSLEHLNISGNEVTYQGSEYLKEAISKNCKLKHLDVSRCKLQEKETYNILVSLRTFTYLKSLNLQQCCFNYSSALKLLPNVIIRNCLLQHLDLTDCNLKENELIAIAKALQQTIALKYISLSSNCITNAASQEIALTIGKNCKLQYLVLSNCGLEETGLIAIAEALCELSSVKHVDLSHSNITDKAVTTVASGIANNTTMQYLDFSFCEWQTTGISVIHQVINKLPMIKEVDLRLLFLKSNE